MSERSMRRARQRALRKAGRRRGAVKKFGVSLGVAMSVGVAFAPVASAATYTVNTTADGGDGVCDAEECTLREAISLANDTPGPDVVTFASTVTGTITLTDGTLVITDETNVVGPGADVLTIDGGGNSGIFQAGEGYYEGPGEVTPVTISGLTLTGATPGEGDSFGAAVAGFNAALTISDAVITGNQGGIVAGGVVSIYGSLEIAHSEISDNIGGLYGGGIATVQNVGPVVIRESTVSGNTALVGGGMLVLGMTGDVTVVQSTISGNSAESGGGLAVADAYFEEETLGAFSIENSTVSGNSAEGAGGGIYLIESDDSAPRIAHSTVVNNTAGASGGGIFRTDENSGEAVVSGSRIENSIVANNTAPDGDLGDPGSTGDAVVEGAFVLSYSLVEDPGGAAYTEEPEGSNLIGVDPVLGPLADNGGATLTHRPLSGSPVIDAGDPDFVPPPSTDQRGLVRASGRLDMGAVEVDVKIAIGDVAVAEGDSGTVAAAFPVTLSSPASSPITVAYATVDDSATAPGDYTAASGTLTFAPGETSKTVTVSVNGDLDEESAETFKVVLSAPTGAVIVDGEGVGTISADDVDGLGYRMVAADGGIFTFGDRVFHGSTGDMTLNKPIVGGATDPSDNEGYWIVASDGGIFTFGADFFGSLGDQPLSSPAVEIEPTPTGKGYWVVLADGKVYTFGDANHFGDMSGKALNKPIVGMAVTPTGKGYWLVAEDGGIFNFGDAGFFGSMGDKVLNAPVIDLAPSVDNQGYYLLGRDGGVFTFGSADFKGSTGAMTLNAPVIAMLVSPDGKGYWLAATDGGVFTFGSIPYLGSMGGTKLNSPVLDLIQ